MSDLTPVDRSHPTPTIAHLGHDSFPYGSRIENPPGSPNRDARHDADRVGWLEKDLKAQHDHLDIVATLQERFARRDARQLFGVSDFEAHTASTSNTLTHVRCC